MEPIRILVIDDEPVICDGCRLTLSDQCFSVDSCNSGTTGLEMLLGGEYDLALLDMKLPDMNGMEILRLGDIVESTQFHGVYGVLDAGITGHDNYIYTRVFVFNMS